MFDKISYCWKIINYDLFKNGKKKINKYIKDKKEKI